MDHIVTSPTSPVPVVVERWLSRSRYLRWIDAGIAWLVLAVLAASVLPRPSAGAIAPPPAAVLLLGPMVPAPPVRPRAPSGRVSLPGRPPPPPRGPAGVVLGGS